ncbi:MAG: DUF4945 domain-containing protein [Bacteroidales bacterium]|nr:DUF4945 domain-containing protein [Bacteroidales bacterium]
MKTSFYIIMCSFFLILSGCYDRDIIDEKEGEPLAPVTSLGYTINGTDVILSWALPSGYPADILQPVSVVLYVYRDGTLINTITVPEAPTTYTYTSYNSANTYRMTVKVRGAVDSDEPNQSKIRLSPGVTVVF